MSVNTSLPIVNPDDSVDEYVRQYFDTYFDSKFSVDENQYEIVKAFFSNRTSNPSNPSIAANTVAVLLAADQLKMYPSDLIKRIDTPDYKKTFGIVLNLTRTGTSLIGYEQPRPVSQENRRQVTA